MVPFSVLIVNAMLGLFGTCMETRWVFFSLIPTIRARASLVLLDDAIATSFTMAAGFRDEEGTSLSCWLLNGSSSIPGWPARRRGVGGGEGKKRKAGGGGKERRGSRRGGMKKKVWKSGEKGNCAEQKQPIHIKKWACMAVGSSRYSSSLPSSLTSSKHLAHTWYP